MNRLHVPCNRAGRRSLPVCLALLLWLGLLLAGCGELDGGLVGPLLHDVSVSPERISPNADGSNDATEIRYSLRRAANVDITFTNEAGESFSFREGRRRAPGDYSVLWGGVIDEPRTLADGEEGAAGAQELLSRVLPDGRYTWRIAASEESAAGAEAADGAGAAAGAESAAPVAVVTGTIVLEGGDSTLPLLNNFAVVPETFRPNQDGLRDDWVSVSYYLTKDVSSMLVYLTDPNAPDLRYFIAETPGEVEPTERGHHDLRYEGGVDLNAEPPPDGDYLVVAEARDLAGNAVRVSRPLRILEGGKPRADIAGSEIQWQGEVNRVVFVPLGGKLCFEAVVVNEGAVPIRTSGPWPGAEYRFAENSNTLAAREDESWFQQAGVWRFGVNFDTTGVDFPYRWAIGRKQDLEMRLIDGKEQYYLMPGARGVVSGCILIDEKPPVGTTVWWGGLIHEFVAVANNNVDRITVNVGAP